ncbi:MAG TPA: dihydroorotase [Chlamydiales bacterium]|nr:dihydroorotase [Chlamydiales bacterium]
MIEIRKVQTTDGHRIDHFITSDTDTVIDASQLMLFPALIDPHVHFRVPGGEHKEDWESGAKAAIAGGVTTVFDMPNNDPPCTTLSHLIAKQKQIEAQIAHVKIPLRYRLFFGADANHLSEIPKVKEKVVGLKIYMGSSTGSLLMSDRAALEEAFRIAADCDLLVAVHAEDERLIQLHRETHKTHQHPSVHSLIRNSDVAAASVDLAIELAKKHRVRLYIVHVSSQKELDLIRSAKKEGLSVYAEASPHHLFLTTSSYDLLGTRALVNPPLRADEDCRALWTAIHDETIDTIGTDHAPHTLEEKSRPFGSAPSGFPSIELYFSLLLNAYHEKQLSLEQIVSLTHTRPQEIFDLPLNDDVVLVDLNQKKTVDNSSLKTKAKWSPYAGKVLQGWPRYTVLAGTLFDLETF